MGMFSLPAELRSIKVGDWLIDQYQSIYSDKRLVKVSKIYYGGGQFPFEHSASVIDNNGKHWYKKPMPWGCDGVDYLYDEKQMGCLYTLSDKDKEKYCLIIIGDS